MFGREMNISGGPLAGAMPNANTAGITTRAESIAASVSKTAVFIDDFGSD